MLSFFLKDSLEISLDFLCTFLLRSGLDPRTVMKYTGHADLATIMRYLAPAELSETQEKINSIAWSD